MNSKLKMNQQCALIATKAVYCAVVGRREKLIPQLVTREIASGVLSSFWEPLRRGQRLKNVSVRGYQDAQSMGVPDVKKGLKS